ncbi:MAG: hybrid sensor histidine kinase/response regulator [Enterovirga sp.]|jgi:PAS domain S-box-containing protein|nr:hybrid sensor histidine kinase/response regulator [Enterovirga sp.]
MTNRDETGPAVASGSEAGLERLSKLPAEQLQLALAAAGAVGTWDWDLVGGRLYADPRFAVLNGLDPADAAAGVDPSVLFARIHPADRLRIRIGVAGILEGADLFSREYRLMAPDGGVRWIQARGRCLRDKDERPLRFAGVLVDITEQKRTEERLRIAQSAGGVGAFEYVPGYGTAEVSEQFCRLLGLRPSKIVPVSLVNALVTCGGALFGPDMDGRAPGQIAHAEFEIRRPDTGALQWLARRSEAVSHGDTAILRHVGVIYDITDTKLAETELRAFSERLESMVETRTRERDRIWQNSRDLLVVLGTDGVLQAVNPAWTELLGFEARETIGRPLLDFVHRDDVETTSRCLAAAADRSAASFENRLLDRSGSPRWFSWTASCESEVVYANGRHVTREKEQAEALKATEEQLRQAQKMEAVGQLTGGIAHDFNNLLTGVVGALDLLQTRLAQGRTDNLERYAKAAISSASRAAALTHRLLAFSRRQPLDPKPVHANQLVTGMEDLLRRTLGEKIRLEIVTAEELWLTRCDPNQLENALLNLAINARDAMTAGGTLTIETCNTHLDRAYAAQHAEVSPGQYVCVAVTDTGSGMPPDVIQRAFDPFFTTKPIGQGTGLGLSMIYGFARQSDGHVKIYSGLGEGTMVKLYLPRHDAQMPAQASKPRAEIPWSPSGETILVVEDEPVVRELIIEVLGDLGYHSLQASDGAAGLRLLESDERIDLLITDIGLPGLNGRQLADAARLRRSDLKVLFITGYAENATISSGFLEPGMEMITKPFSIDALALRVRQIIEKA